MESFLEWERKQNAVAFTRTETRCTRLKRRLDCGHVIDGSQPYRYHVFKLNSDTSLNQRTDCEVCARADVSY